MEINPNVNHVVVANPVLVEPTAEGETTEDSDTNEAQSIVVLSRMDVIFQKRMEEGLTIEDQLIAYVRGWGPNACLDLAKLQKKIIIWIGIASMMRPRLDLDGRLLGVSLTSREPKESQWKTIKIGTAEQAKDDCPVRTLAEFMDHTASLRHGLPDDHTLFLAEIEKGEQAYSTKPATAVSGYNKQCKKPALTLRYTKHVH
ncbi:hypothetical protein G6F70_007492 [Rhizopus microsporus]|nr:hypothetical protein G6F71_008132 [Rhizopus microsporus]KAG1196380.1 hypothetical protein G6F70_007492 [Rhizopus microsporus]KAG1208121.1 hypothetical protein G6F69_007488 [Rhizopus microsporus]KAG1229322.1 hypothetical protein G6F67_007234 [Rhizopus microsporus]KAG1260077.1 hypothetical protein G6F68_007680 [Rhizopus microsporus]